MTAATGLVGDCRVGVRFLFGVSEATRAQHRASLLALVAGAQRGALGAR
jgi:hypothetical protein